MKKRGPGYGSLAIFMIVTDLTIIGGLVSNGVSMQQIGSAMFMIGLCVSFIYMVLG